MAIICKQVLLNHFHSLFGINTIVGLLNSRTNNFSFFPTIDPPTVPTQKMDPSKVLKYTIAILASLVLMVTVPVDAGKKQQEDVIVIAGGGGGGC